MRILKQLLLIAVLFCSALYGHAQNIEDYFFPNGNEVILHSNFMANAYNSYIRQGNSVTIKTGVTGSGGGVISRRFVGFRMGEKTIFATECAIYSFGEEIQHGYFNKLWLRLPEFKESILWMGYQDIIDEGEPNTNYQSCFRYVRIGSEIVEALKVTNEVKDIEQEKVIGECTQYWCKGYGLLYEETKPLDSGKPIIYSDYRFKGEVNDNPFKSLNDDTDIGVNDMANESSAEDETEEDEAIPLDSECFEAPSFNGGDTNDFSRWVNFMLNYPEAAKENGIEGKVVLSFTVNAKGIVKNVTVLKSASPLLDEEAVRVVSSSPKWTPGRIDGKPVKVTYSFPVFFQLR